MGLTARTVKGLQCVGSVTELLFATCSHRVCVHQWFFSLPWERCQGAARTKSIRYMHSLVSRPPLYFFGAIHGSRRGEKNGEGLGTLIM